MPCFEVRGTRSMPCWRKRSPSICRRSRRVRTNMNNGVGECEAHVLPASVEKPSVVKIQGHKVEQLLPGGMLVQFAVVGLCA